MKGIPIPYITTLDKLVPEINDGSFNVTFRVQTEQNVIINMTIHHCKFVDNNNGMMEVKNKYTPNPKYKLLLSIKMLQRYILFEQKESEYVFVYMN